MKRATAVVLAAGCMTLTACSGGSGDPYAIGTPYFSSPSAATISAAQEARVACDTFQSSVAPVIQTDVAAGDLAPIVRLSMGIDPSSADGQSNPNAPYFAAVSGASEAALDDPIYRPLDDAMSALTDAITEADPSSDLGSVAQASQDVLAACQQVS